MRASSGRHTFPRRVKAPSSSTSLEVTAAAAMSNGETRALLPKAGGARAPLPRASDVGVTADGSAEEKKPRWRWQVTAAGALLPCAAALFVLICALSVTSGRGGDAVSVRARLGTEADDFFHTQFRGENALAFSSDASAGLGLKTHRRGAEEIRENAEEDGSGKNAAGLSKNAEAEETKARIDAPEKEVEAAKKPEKQDLVDEEASETKKAKTEKAADALSSKTSTKKAPSSSEVSSSSEKKAQTSDLLGDVVSEERAVSVANDVPSSATSSAPSASKPTKTKEKPKILVAVISWHDGAEEVAAMERTWLGALQDANEHMDADYRVFVGEYDEANLGGKHAELRKAEHRERRGFGRDEIAAALGTRGIRGFRAGEPIEPKPSSGSGSGFSVGSVSSLGKSRGEKGTASKEKKRTFDSDAEIDELAEDLAEAVDAFEEERTGAAPTREWAIFSDGADADSSADSSDDSSLGRGHEEMSKREFTSRLAEAVSKAKAQALAEEEAKAAEPAKASKASTKSATASKTTTYRDDASSSANEASSSSSSSSSDAKTKTPKTKQSPRENAREAPPSKTVELPVGDAYEDLSAKVLAAIQYAAEHDYDYVYKVDTDVFVIPEIFLKYVKTQVADKKIDWMGTENKMDFAILDESVDFTDFKNAEIVQANSSPSGFKCKLTREWHFGKCTDDAFNHQRYAGVNPVSVDGGHGYVLSKAAMWAVSDFAFKRSDDLERHRRIDIYEDQLVSHILVKQGFLPVDYSGVAPYEVSGMTKEMADDSCALANDPLLGAAVGDRLRAMFDYRFESGADLYETAEGWNPRTLDARMLPTSLLRVGIQPYVSADSMDMKWEYYNNRETIAAQRADGTYEPRLLPAGFELVPDLSHDPFAVPEFPEFPNEASKKKGSEDGSIGDVTRTDAKDAKATDAKVNDADAELEARSKRKASDPAKDLEAFKNSLDDFHVFDRAPARSGGSDESKETNDDDDENENARPGAWITVEELSDDPFAEPEWRGDADALVKAQVEEMLAAKRDERRAAGDAAADDEAAAAEAKAEEKQKRRFEMEEAKREAEEEEEEAKSTATIEADDSYDGVAEDDDDR